MNARHIVNVASTLAEAVTVAPLDWIEHEPDPTTTWADVDVLDGEWVALQVRTPAQAEARAGEPINPGEVLAVLTGGDLLYGFEPFHHLADLGPTTPDNTQPGFQAVEKIPPAGFVLAALHASSIAYRGAPWIRLRLGVYPVTGGPGHALDIMLPAETAPDVVGLILAATQAAHDDQAASFPDLDDEATP